MRVLLISSRCPRPHGHGDQSRAYSFARFLSARGHDVEILSGEPSRNPHEAEVLASLGQFRAPGPHQPRHRAASAALALAQRQPGQVGWMMPARTWKHAVSAARRVDVALAITVRSVRGPLAVPLVTDFVNALSWDMRERARGGEAARIRAAARFEAARLANWERRVAGWSAAGVATSGEVAAALPSTTPMHVIPVAWDGADAGPSETRDIDVIFTGDMRYPPNRQAAVVLANEIMPLVRKRRPGTELWLVGRHASDLEFPGTVTRSDVPDIAAYLSRARVAACPIAGRGSPYKILEAAAAGAAVVASPWAVQCYGMDAETAEAPLEFANAIMRLLEAEELRAQRAAQGREAVRANSMASLGGKLEVLLLRAAGLT